MLQPVLTGLHHKLIALPSSEPRRTSSDLVASLQKSIAQLIDLHKKNGIARELLRNQETQFIQNLEQLQLQGQVSFSLFILLVPFYDQALKKDDRVTMKYLEYLIQSYSWAYSPKAFMLLHKNQEQSPLDLTVYRTLDAQLQAIKNQHLDFGNSDYSWDGKTRFKDYFNVFTEKSQVQSLRSSSGVLKNSELFPTVTAYFNTSEASVRTGLAKDLEAKTIYKGTFLSFLNENFEKFLNSEYYTIRPLVVEAYLNSTDTAYLPLIAKSPNLPLELRLTAIKKMATDKTPGRLAGFIRHFLEHGNTETERGLLIIAVGTAYQMGNTETRKDLLISFQDNKEVCSMIIGHFLKDYFPSGPDTFGKSPRPDAVSAHPFPAVLTEVAPLLSLDVQYLIVTESINHLKLVDLLDLKPESSDKQWFFNQLRLVFPSEKTLPLYEVALLALDGKLSHPAMENAYGHSRNNSPSNALHRELLASEHIGTLAKYIPHLPLSSAVTFSVHMAPPFLTDEGIMSFFCATYSRVFNCALALTPPSSSLLWNQGYEKLQSIYVKLSTTCKSTPPVFHKELSSLGIINLSEIFDAHLNGVDNSTFEKFLDKTAAEVTSQSGYYLASNRFSEYTPKEVLQYFFLDITISRLIVSLRHSLSVGALTPSSDSTKTLKTLESLNTASSRRGLDALVSIKDIRSFIQTLEQFPKENSGKAELEMYIFIVNRFIWLTRIPVDAIEALQSKVS